MENKKQNIQALKDYIDELYNKYDLDQNGQLDFIEVKVFLG